MAKTETTEKAVLSLEEQIAAHAKEKVEVYVPIDPNDKTPLYVAVNGRNWAIKRGSKVIVPRFVAEVLESSNEQALLVSELETAGKEKADKI